MRQQIFQLKQAFYTAILARENLRVADENLYLINNTQQLIALHVRTGDTAEGDLIKFQANSVQYQRDLMTAQLSYNQAGRDVLTLLGANPANVGGSVVKAGLNKEPDLLEDAPIAPVGDLQIEVTHLSLDELRQAALEQRPDVIVAQRNLEAAQKAVELANALRRRDVDVGLEYQRTGSDNTFGVVVSVPFFLHNNHQAEIDQALAQQKQAETQYNLVKLQALADVDKAFRAYQSSQRMLQLYTLETLDKAEEAFRIAGAAYKQGATSLLEVLDAQRTYNLTRVAANQARYDYRMSIYQLELATGKSLLKELQWRGIQERNSEP
jgi:cobalt-zinc-cadmium efflux system outer membrane protein